MKITEQILKLICENQTQTELENNSQLGLHLNNRYGFYNVTLLDKYFSNFFIGEINEVNILNEHTTIKSYISECKNFEVLEYFGNIYNKNKGYFVPFKRVFIHISEFSQWYK